jgi:hypothetical protein
MNRKSTGSRKAHGGWTMFYPNHMITGFVTEIKLVQGIRRGTGVVSETSVCRLMIFFLLVSLHCVDITQGENAVFEFLFGPPNIKKLKAKNNINLLIKALNYPASKRYDDYDKR